MSNIKRVVHIMSHEISFEMLQGYYNTPQKKNKFQKDKGRFTDEYYISYFIEKEYAKLE